MNQLTLLVLMIAMLAYPTAVHSGIPDCSNWMPGPLHGQQPAGINGYVLASTVWDPPNGPPLLVVGGLFSEVGGVAVNNIAAWDGASWRPLGLGVTAPVWSLTVYNGDLIAGGTFLHAGGQPAARIARFDGNAWHAMGTGLQESFGGATILCRALTTFNGDLIAGGKFNKAGGVPVVNVARWNGSTWGSISGDGSGAGNQFTTADDVRAMAVFNNALYVGGWFNSASSVLASNIVRFTGTQWEPLSLGADYVVNALQVFGSELIVGGLFDGVGTINAKGVARWSASGQWAAMGPGLGSDSTEGVFALGAHNGLLYAGGRFSSCIFAWNGTFWAPVGGGIQAFPQPAGAPIVYAISSFGNKMVAGGDFASASSVPGTTHLGQWSGTAWSALESPKPQIFAFTTLGNQLFVGGSFVQSATDSPPTQNLLAWNGSSLTRLSGGLNASVLALKAFTTSLQGITFTNIVAGGTFTLAGEASSGDLASASRIAMWTELNGSGWWSPMGSGFDGTVLSIERFNGTVVAGGSFFLSGSTVCDHIGRWNNTSWQPMGNGMNQHVRALKAFTQPFPSSNVELVAAGDFTIAGSVAANRIARWVETVPPTHGSAWTAMGAGFNATVMAIERHAGSTYAAGAFTASGATTLNRIARWNGSTWVVVGNGTGFNGTVRALRSIGSNLYAGGEFTMVDGIAAPRVARWNGSAWSAVDGGADDIVHALGAFQSELIAGGSLDDVGAPAIASPGLSRFSESSVPWIVTQPSSQLVECDGSVTLSVRPAPGYLVLTYQWRRGATPLTNGDTGHGSTISGGQTPDLVIQNVATGDVGDYSCVVTTQCGSVTTNTATLTVNGCCVSDVNSNGITNVEDLLVVISQWGTCPAPPSFCGADIAPQGGNGLVNVEDLLAVINGWGACP